MADSLEPVSFKQDDVIISQGDPGEDFFIIVEVVGGRDLRVFGSFGGFGGFRDFWGFRGFWGFFWVGF